MDSKRLKELAGIMMITEMEDEKKGPKKNPCPFCDNELEHGKLTSHIKDVHKDLVKQYHDEHKDD